MQTKQLTKGEISGFIEANGFQSHYSGNTKTFHIEPRGTKNPQTTHVARVLANKMQEKWGHKIPFALEVVTSRKKNK